MAWEKWDRVVDKIRWHFQSTGHYSKKYRVINAKMAGCTKLQKKSEKVMQWANTLPTEPRLNQHGEKNSSTNLSLSASGCVRSTHITNVVSTQTSGRVSTKKGSIHASRMGTYNYPQFWQGHNLKFLLSLLSRKPGLIAACIWSSKCFAKLLIIHMTVNISRTTRHRHPCEHACILLKMRSLAPGLSESILFPAMSIKCN